MWMLLHCVSVKAREMASFGDDSNFGAGICVGALVVEEETMDGAVNAEPLTGVPATMRH